MQYGAIGDTFYFNFVVVDSDGNGKQLPTVSWALRKCGRPITDAAVLSGSSALYSLSHSDYNDGKGCCEIAIDSSSLTSGSTYALYAWSVLTDGTSPAAMVGQLKLTETGAIPGTATASPPGQTTGYATTYGKNGQVEPNVNVTCQLLRVNPTVTGVVFDSEVRIETSNSEGLIQFTGLFPGATYSFKRRTSINTESDGYEITIPLNWTADTFALPPIIGTP